MLAVCGVACVPENGGPGDIPSTSMTFTVDITDITSGGATVNIVPSNDNTYYFGVEKKAYIDQYASLYEFATESITDLKSLLDMYGIPLSDYLSTGNDSNTLNSLNPDTEYYAYVFGVSAEGAVITDVTLKEFKTLVDNGEPSSNTFSISVTDITSSTATVSVTPSNSDTYYFDVFKKADYDQYGGDSQFLEYWQADIKSYIEELNNQGYNITIANFVSSGNDMFAYEGNYALEPNTEYYVFAFGLSTGGRITTDVTKKAFTTLANDDESSSNTFAISVADITSTGATVSVTPSNNDTYYFDVIEKDIYDTYTDKKALAAEYIAEIKNYYESYGYSFADVLSSGKDAYSFEGYLDANTAYYAFAVGVTTSGAITTDVTTVEFATLASGGGNTGGSTGGDKDLTCFEVGYFENWGDYYGTNALNWYIDLYSSTTNDFFVLELQGDLSETAPVAGEYQLLSTFAVGTAVAGGFDADGYIYGTYWGLLDDNWESFVDYALCTSGTVKVSKSGDLYNIDVDAVGENGESVKVSYAGVLEEWVEEYSLAAQKLSNNLTKRFCTVSRMMKQKQLKMAPKTVLKKQAHSIVKLTPKKVAPKSVSSSNAHMSKKVAGLLSAK